MPRKAIQDRQEDLEYVESNIGLIPMRVIASHLNTTLADVFRMKKKIERIRLEESPPAKNIKRPPCEYQNRTREQVMDYYMTLVL